MNFKWILLILFLLILTFQSKNILIFVRGVDEIRQDWMLAEDGSLIILPVGSNKIVLTNM